MRVMDSSVTNFALESRAFSAFWRDEELDFLGIVFDRRVGGGMEGRRGFGDT